LDLHIFRKLNLDNAWFWRVSRNKTTRIIRGLMQGGGPGLLIAARILIFSYYTIFPTDVTCVVIPAPTPSTTEFVTSSPRNEQGTLGRNVGSDGRDQGQIWNETHDCQPCVVRVAATRSHGSTWLISRTVGTYVVNPMCMKRLAVNSRMRNDRRKETGEPQPQRVLGKGCSWLAPLALKVIQFVEVRTMPVRDSLHGQ
jgi:hypothetical protein